ncbi:MAG: FtsQ-type POTRA domain-containing protein [Patescibacteria group bacterium]
MAAKKVALGQARIPLTERRRRKKMRFAGVIACLIGICVLGVYVSMYFSWIRIHAVAFDGNARVTTLRLQTLFNTETSGRYWFGIPRDNAAFVPLSRIHDRITSIPLIASATVARSSLTSLTVHVVERAPAALWCSSGDCYLMDSGGYIYSVVYPDMEVEHFRRYGGGVASAPVGSVYLDGQFKILYDFVALVEQSTARSITSVDIDGEDVSLVLSTGGMIRFVLGDIDVSLAKTMGSVLTSSKFDTTKTLDYADFRFIPRVVVKYKE